MNVKTKKNRRRKGAEKKKRNTRKEEEKEKIKTYLTPTRPLLPHTSSRPGTAAEAAGARIAT